MKFTQIHPVTRSISDCGRCTVRENSLFSDFTEEDFRLIQAPIEDFRFAPGAIIYKQGDKATGLYTIRSGMVKLNRLNIDGTQRILRILRTGDIIGLEASLSPQYENDAGQNHQRSSHAAVPSAAPIIRRSGSDSRS